MEKYYDLKEEFLNFWSEDNVKKMTLDEYTNLDKKNSFCYWLESKTTELGSIWGGSAYKFGIYKRSDLTKVVDAKNRKTEDGYAWYTKYGDTKEEAFKSVKEIILKIIEASKENNLQKIENIDLGAAYKWKIAFLYSNFNLLNIFKFQALKYLAEKNGFSSKKKKLFEFQQFLMSLKPETADYFTYSHSLWNTYEQDILNTQQKESLKRKDLFVKWLTSKNLNTDIAEELDALSEEVLIKGKYDKFIYDCINYHDVYELSFKDPIDDNWDNLYEHYFKFTIDEIKKETGVDLNKRYAIVTVKNSTEFNYFIKNNIWKADNKNVYDTYVNRFETGDYLGIYKWEKGQIIIGCIGIVTENPKTGFELSVNWFQNFEKFSVTLNSDPVNLDFYQIEPQKSTDKIEDIKNIFYAVNINSLPMKEPLNQILYGAPGTGKTYQTKKKAVEIIDNVDHSKSKREEILERYDVLYTLGQINFTTFHQSMSYEDFIEGIKPVLSPQDDTIESTESKTGTIEYEIKDGIFKRICLKAKGISGNIDSSQKIDFQNKNFYKMSLGGKNRLDLHNWSIENNLIFLGWGGENDFTSFKDIHNWKQYKEKFKKEFSDLVKESKFVIQAVYTFQNMKIGDVVLISKGNKIIDAIGIIESDYYYDDSKDIELFQFRKIKWLATNMNTSPEVFVNKGISQQAIYQFYNKDIILETFTDYFNSNSLEKTQKKYVLIIDEINRGNVSSIFGELITLLETEKRQGTRVYNPEFIEVELPYSNEKFSVPDNLFLIGTMNTADRSVEALDTALRRRFSFIEMKSNPDLLYTEHISKGIITNKDKTEINLISILKNLNERIELLIDKDHQIGHSFFIKTQTFDELRVVFKDNIIPLLEEYFFGDYGKIGLVLGGEFIKPKKTKPNFPKNFTYGEDGDISNFTDKVVYEFTPLENWNSYTFTSIYE
jgi:5-methylcytosine-specific restriction endonuclease McrBC GTP-binding regulatory subunit McrB